MEKLSLPSLFPTIFDPKPIGDIVALHCVLFSIQYACAKSWLDSGLEVETMIGHSFGQLTALCLSGSLSLLDTIGLVAERARLVKEHCSQQAGLMLAVEGTEIEGFLHRVRKQHPDLLADIACFNGPCSYVIAGDEVSISVIEAAMKNLQTGIRSKRLANSHAFHSRLLDGIIPGLRHAAGNLHFKAPTIPIEACSTEEDWSEITPEKIVRHSRLAVHFMEAVRRVESRIKGPIVWLEAGSGSPIIPMVKKAVLPQRLNQQHVYVATSLRNSDAELHLSNATRLLWYNGVKVQFWPFHQSQQASYNWMNLPPYQFAKTSHWLEYKPVTATKAISEPIISAETNPGLVRLLSDQSSSGQALFEINVNHELFRLGTEGHSVVGQTLCPSSLHIEFLLTATSLLPNDGSNMIPRITGLTMSSPLVLCPAGRVFLKLVGKDLPQRSWDFTIFSHDDHASTSSPVSHATGRIAFDATVLPQSISHFQSLSSLIHKRCDEIESCSKSIGFKGPTVYQAMHPAVTYTEFYQGIASIYTLEKEAVAHVILPPSRPVGMGTGFCDPVLTDNFNQVSGVLANCFAGRQDTEMCINGFIGEIAYSQQFIECGRKKQSWKVYCKYEDVSPKKLRCDTFVFEPESGDLVLTVMSTEFQKVSTKSLSRTLARLNSHEKSKDNTLTNPTTVQAGEPTCFNDTGGFEITSRRIPDCMTNGTTTSDGNGNPYSNSTNKMTNGIAGIPTDNVIIGSTVDGTAQASRPMQEQLQAFHGNTDPDSTASIYTARTLIADILQVSMEEVHADSLFSDLGIDSLLTTEIYTELKKLKVQIALADIVGMSSIQELADIIRPASTSAQPPKATLPKQSAMWDASAGTEKIQTVSYGKRGEVSLLADIYYPHERSDTPKRLPVGKQRLDYTKTCIPH